mmetsp:Transcript_15695/g.46822  ORF Transcript_15695/g.46822 Transcript_15695/m.46822 type:complete len:186 (-) Transcript_15695:67-624(-)|eukprot:CAMPEP_0119272114 /NCGR_PEP_ID=MMETSP1329-20130426/8425_1 /TAXON_ID=114041 /ORGANISM="Genus nov. species nov., Strain RCC1024" /LENGTH=185 /DNA_ID=CAMNT_0007272167 /DNA_START=88 /DNA_END=645 /DNA_ORIENTATION=+
MGDDGLAKTVELVQTSWKQVTDTVDVETAGVILFKHIFRIAPQALPLFSFKGVSDGKIDEKLFGSTELKTHGAKVVATVGTAVQMLGKLDALVPILQELGTKHVAYGVVPAHYEVVGEALIATLGDALGEKFTDDVKEAWLAVYGIVKTTMIGNNYKPKEEAAEPESLATMVSASMDDATLEKSE